MKKSVGITLASAMLMSLAVSAGSTASAYTPGKVYLYQPFSALSGASITATYHSYTEGLSSLHPVDVNKGYDEGGERVAVDLVGLPAGSTVYYTGYNSNRTPCSGVSGDRYVVDLWVKPPGKTKKYLGFVLLMHTQNNKIGSWTATDTDNDGRVWYWTSEVWDGPDGTSLYNSSGGLCWTGDHIHMYGARDTSFESTYGTYTTGVNEAKTSIGTTYNVTTDQALYYFTTDWDK